MVNKSDFIQWRDLAITKGLFEELREVAEGIAQELVTRESSNNERDQFLKGFLKAVDQVIGWRPEFIEENQDES